jgi:hypothetical protein
MNDGGDGAPSKDRKPELDGKNKRSGKGNRNKQAGFTPWQTFEGQCKELKGNIYDCSDIRQSDMFAKTTKEISTYVGRVYKGGKDISTAVDNLQFPELLMPEEPDDNVTLGKTRYWEKKLDAFVKRKELLADNMGRLYSLVWGQCTEMMKQKVEAMDEYAEHAKEKDGIELLKMVRSLCFSYQSQKHVAHSLVESLYRFATLRQGKDMHVQTYYKRFKNTIEVVEASGGSIGHHPRVCDYILDEKDQTFVSLNDAEKRELKKETCEQFLATAFMLGADRARYGNLIAETQNEFLKGVDNYPSTLVAAYNLLVNYSVTQGVWQESRAILACPSHTWATKQTVMTRWRWSTRVGRTQRRMQKTSRRARGVISVSPKTTIPTNAPQRQRRKTRPLMKVMANKKHRERQCL